jgi:hypothetical protein
MEDKGDQVAVMNKTYRNSKKNVILSMGENPEGHRKYVYSKLRITPKSWRKLAISSTESFLAMLMSARVQFIVLLKSVLLAEH